MARLAQRPAGVALLDDLVLLDELRRETETAESVDWLVSFVKMSGLRPMMPVLERFAERGGRLRVVTTTYVGATDPEAVLWLSSLPNAEIFVAYDTGATRHHAKSYLFHRSHGLSTAYAGSANLSKAALSYGLEWTVKVTQASDAALLERMKTIFEAYVTDAERFKRFDPVRDEAQLREAIQEARRGESGASLSSATPLSTFGIELEPYPFQKAILERLDAARTLHGETRSLVVAATGTGKTMIAAFDYRERARKLGRRENLLFVAHREEILLQARNAFRYVLNDMNFGELFTGSETPKEHRHVFLSVQTAASRDLAHFYPPEHFEYVVVDEFHHAAAQSYRALLDTLDPKVLLGLTATPWRGDGRDVLERFGGRITAELGLGDAIDRQLLVPFDYLMVTDPVSLAGLKWTRGSYAASELEDLYTEGGSARDRDRAVLGALRRYLPDLSDVRGIVFCAGRRHAAHVAKVLCEAGIPSAAIDGETPAEERRNAPRRLVSGELRFLCTVDVYNEGVDIPEVNTVLFLRPTESVTIFLQQLGRGLRKCADKLRLTVLDFVGSARKEFSFEARLRALTRAATANVVDLVEGTDSTLLPLGCTLTLEKQAMEDVLANIKAHRRLKGRELEVAGLLINKANRSSRTFCARRTCVSETGRFGCPESRRAGTIFSSKTSLQSSTPAAEPVWRFRKPSDFRRRRFCAFAARTDSDRLRSFSATCGRERPLKVSQSDRKPTGCSSPSPGSKRRFESSAAISRPRRPSTIRFSKMQGGEGL